MINGIGSSTATLLGGVSGGTANGIARLVGSRTQTSSALTTSAAIVADGAPIETDRVSSLRAAIRAGSYRADPAAIASKMMSADMGVAL